MRCYWVIAVLCNLLCFGMVMIIFGQREEAKLLLTREEQQKRQALTADAELMDRGFHRGNVQKLVDQAFKLQEDLEAEVTKLVADKEWNLNTNNNCWVVEGNVRRELENKQKEFNEVKGNYKSELETREAELKRQKMRAEQPSEICKFVKLSKLAESLCGPTNKEELLPNQNQSKGSLPSKSVITSANII